MDGARLYLMVATNTRAVDSVTNKKLMRVIRVLQGHNELSS